MARKPRSKSSKTKAESPKNANAEPTAYCMHCRAKKPIRDALQGTGRNGAPILSGQCVDCGTNVVRMLGCPKGANAPDAPPLDDTKDAHGVPYAEKSFMVNTGIKQPPP